MEFDADTRPFASLDAPELLVKKKEREESMCMCMRTYMCDM